MGRKKDRLARRYHEEAEFDKHFEDHGAGPSHMCAKHLSKKNKKNKKKMAKKHQVTITKEHRWYQIRVHDTAAPSKAFLEESFRSVVDTEFVMLGFYSSTHSSRFFLENNSSAAAAITALDKRMQGATGKPMTISRTPTMHFMVLNAQQLLIVKQVLERRFDATASILDMSNFHMDPLFLEHNLLPVLWDPAICKQVLVSVRDNIPNLKGIVLGNNGLKLTNIRVVAGTLKNCPLQGINLEENNIENVKELINVLSVFPVVELKLEGNNCLSDIKNPVLYIKTVMSRLIHLKVLDGVPVESYLTKQEVVPSVADNTAGISGLSVSAAAEPSMSEELVQQYLKEYYTCFGNDRRLDLIHAYLPTATFALESSVTPIPTGVCEGSELIFQALTAFPATKFNKESFVMQMKTMTESLVEVEVTGELQIEDWPTVIKFEHSFQIVPYNSGMGCSHSKMTFR